MQSIPDILNPPAVVHATNSNQIVEAIRWAKQGARGFVTNFFAGRKQIDCWVNRAELSILQAGRCLWIRRRDRDFFHLHYFATDMRAVEESLAGIGAIADKAVLAIDLVGRESDVSPMAEMFRRHGFTDQAVLVRMSRCVDPASLHDGSHPDVGPAIPDDASAVLDLLERQFDRYSKQVPVEDEIRESISGGSILVVRRDTAIAGLLFFEAAGTTATLRYWCVDASFRDQGVGAKLIKTFFHHCRACRSIVLWVHAKNENAIRRYRHYGFQETDTQDLILVRG